MRIDSHQHFWNFDPRRDTWITPDMKAIRRDFGPGDLRSELEANGISGSVAVQAGSSEAETRFLLDIADRSEFVKGVVGWVDLTDAAVENRLQYYKESAGKLVGFRHTVQDEPDDQFLLRPDFCRGVPLLEKYDFTYDILIYPKQLPAAIAFVEKFPDQKFVVDHIAKPDIKNGTMEPWASLMRTLAQNKKVFVKLSGMITEADWNNWQEVDLKPYLDVVFEAFGPRRLLFGSDWPVCLVAGNYAKVKNIVVHYMKDMETKDQEAVMGGNAIAFYQLKINH